MTYDVHQHLWPPGFLAALRARSAAPCLRGAELVTREGSYTIDLTRHEPEHRLAVLDRDGIDVAVLSLQPSLGCEALPPHEREELELAWVEGIEELTAASGGRFLAFAPWRTRVGFAGTSVGASALVDLDGHAQLLAEVDAARGVLFVHPEAEAAVPPGRPEWWSWTAGYTVQMQRAYLSWLAGGRDRFSSLRVVFAILAGGAPIQHERLAHRGVDVRSTIDLDTVFDTASYGRRAIELCIETFGVERLVYGSDTPVVESQQTLDAVRAMGDSVTHLLQTDTPGRLLT